MSDAPGSPSAVRVRPRGALLGVAVLTLLLVTAPLFAVFYWFAASRGLVLPTVAGHVAVVVVCVAIGFRQLAVFAEVRDGRLRGNGIFSPIEQVELSRIAQVDLIATYVGLRPESVQQLLVRDAEGRRLFRMRGNFWGKGALTEVAAALPVAPTIITEPIDLPDFFRRYPGSAYWFENRPALGVTGIILGGIVLAVGTVTISGFSFGA